MENNDQTPAEESKLDAATMKCAEKIDAFAKTKSGNAFVDFLLFKRNLVPYTLQIGFVLAVLWIWWDEIDSVIATISMATEATEMGSSGGRAVGRIIGSILRAGVVIVAAPFVAHYALEVLKYIFYKIGVPLWEKIVLRFFVGVLPEIFPFALERAMKAVDLGLDGLVALFMAVAALLKGMVWLPKMLGQYLEKWYEKMDR